MMFAHRIRKGLSTGLLVLIAVASAIMTTQVYAHFRNLSLQAEYEEAQGLTRQGANVTLASPVTLNEVMERALDTNGDGAHDTWTVSARGDDPLNLEYTATDTDLDGEPDALEVRLDQGRVVYVMDDCDADGSPDRVTFRNPNLWDESIWYLYIDLDFDGRIDIMAKNGTLTGCRVDAEELHILGEDAWIPATDLDIPCGDKTKEAWIEDSGEKQLLTFVDGGWQEEREGAGPERIGHSCDAEQARSLSRIAQRERTEHELSAKRQASSAWKGFTIHPWAAYLASWLGMLGGIWALFGRAEKRASEQTRQSVSNWLRNLENPSAESWPTTFNYLFGRVFGEKHLSWRCIGMSVLTSYLFLAILMTAWAAIHPDVASEFYGNPLSWWQILVVGGVVGLLPGYVSLFETRIVLRQLVKRMGTGWAVFLIAVDFILAGLIFLAGFWAFVLFMGGGVEDHWNIILAGIIMAGAPSEDPSLGPYVYTLYLPSLWLWLYVLSGAGLSRATAKFFWTKGRGSAAFKFLFDTQNRPIKSLGSASMLIVSVAYLAIPLAISLAQQWEP